MKTRKTQKQIVLDGLKSVGEKGATRAQLYKMLDLNPKSVDARLYELELEERAVQTHRLVRPKGAKRSFRVWVVEQYATLEDRAPRPARNRATRELQRLLDKLDAIHELATERGYTEILSIIRCQKNGRYHTASRCDACHCEREKENGREEPEQRAAGGQDGGGEPGRDQQ